MPSCSLSPYYSPPGRVLARKVDYVVAGSIHCIQHLLDHPCPKWHVFDAFILAAVQLEFIAVPITTAQWPIPYACIRHGSAFPFMNSFIGWWPNYYFTTISSIDSSSRSIDSFFPHAPDTRVRGMRRLRAGRRLPFLTPSHPLPPGVII